MAVSEDYRRYVLGQLAPLALVSSRPMFGCAALYSEELIFGLIADDTLYLRVDDESRREYTARGMAPFRPYPDRELFSTTYYAVPADVLEDTEALCIWARRSLTAARTARKPSKKRAKPAKASRPPKRRRRRSRGLRR
ncbi:MAG TPA: TfoX/Sxy family protein [Steroidobacteraceae bacterium]|nr:TfoX/Sxy family protein [Steroidobacteraceae bacterium]